MEEIQPQNINYHEVAQAIQKERVENAGAQELSEREALRNVLVRQTQQTPHTTTPLPVMAPQTSESDASLPSYGKDLPPETQQQVRDLVQLTFEKGVATGLAHAKKLDPVALDAYHDALAEKLLAVLKEKNLL